MRAKLVVLPLAAMLLILCTACTGGNGDPSVSPEASPSPGARIEHAEQPTEGEELMALTETREEAEAIAAQYGIELVSWELNVAVFHTDEDPDEVISRGVKNHWPPLEINAVISLDDPIE